MGGGVMGGVNVGFSKGFRVVGHGMWGSGIGRYMIGSGPDAVVFPIATGPGAFDADLSLVHSGSAGCGRRSHGRQEPVRLLLWRILLRTQFVRGRHQPGAGQDCRLWWNQFSQQRQPRYPGGFNRMDSDFLRNPQYGAVLLVTQASYLTRAPWFVPAGAPKNAHLGMGYLSIRYVLP